MKSGLSISAVFKSATFQKWWSLVSWTNVGFQAGHLLLGGILFMFLWFLLGRTWGAGAFGEFNFLYAYAAIWGIFFDFGLDLPVTRFVSAGGHGIPAPLLRIKILVVTLGMGTALGLALILELSHFSVVVVLLLGVFLFSGTNFINGLLRGLERLDVEAKIGFLQKAAFVAMAAAGVFWYEKGLLWVAGSYLLSHVLGLGVTLVWAFKKRTLSLVHGSMASVRQSILEVIPFWLIALFVSFGQRLDLFMVKGLMDAASVGVYSAGFRIIEGFIYVGAAFMTGFFPRLVQALSEERATGELVGRSAVFLLAAAILIAGVNYFAAPLLISTLYGPSFSQSVFVLQMLGWALPLIFLSWLLGYTLVAFGRERLFVLALVIGLLPDFFANMVTIPRWGVNGAILGFWFREICVFSLLGLFYWRVYRREMLSRVMI